MSINAVGGVSPVPSHAAPASVAKPESAEVKGAPDHDGDADDSAAHAPAQAATGSSATPGHVNVKA
jgi:hypothetical protein